MSLRLRLTFFYIVFLAPLLGFLGITLHFGVKASLYRGLDASLRDALLLARPLLDREHHNGIQIDEVPEGFPPNLALWVFRGQRIEPLGAALGPPPPPRSGCWDDAGGKMRYCGEKVGDTTLVVGRSLEEVAQALDQLDRVLEVTLPATLSLAWFLGYVLAGRALSPLNHMTRRALELARNPDPAARLPEPRVRDELLQLAQAQNLLLSVLEKYLEKERWFLQNAAHELKTPLSALVGRLEQALEQDPLPRVPLERAREAALDLWRLVEHLLLLARTERSPLWEEVDFVQVVLEAQEEVNLRGKALQLDLPFTSCDLVGDPLLLKIAVQNLLDNALKFSRSCVCLRLRCESRVRLDIEDDGSKLAPPAYSA